MTRRRSEKAAWRGMFRVNRAGSALRFGRVLRWLGCEPLWSQDKI